MALRGDTLLAAVIFPEARRIATIGGLRAKRAAVVARWAEERFDGHVGHYMAVTDRMQRLTHAIDTALVKLGVEV